MGLDIQEYRRWENLAKNNTDHIQVIEKHHLVVGKNHTLFDEHYDRKNYNMSGAVTGNAKQMTNHIFSPDETNRTKYTKQELYNLVCNTL